MKRLKFWKKQGTAVTKYQDINSNPSVNKNPLISFEELNKIPLNDVIQIVPERPGAIEINGLYTAGDDLTFRVMMKKGEIWNFHTHDCEETILIHKGTLTVSISKKKYTKGSLFKINKKVTHGVEAVEDSVFYVEFTNPNKQK